MVKKKINQDEHINQNIKISELESANKNLQEKLKLLKIQLESQTQLQHVTYHHSRSASLSRSRISLHSSKLSHNVTGLKTYDNGRVTRKSCSSIHHQLKTLQEELDNVKEQYKNRISELEQLAGSRRSFSPATLKTELNENVELIRLKRLSKKQAAQIVSLQSQLDLSHAEIKQLEHNLSAVGLIRDNLQGELSREKSEVVKLQSDISSLNSNCKLLEEQLNDLQVEKATLKEHNENLLKLSLRREAAPEISDLKANFLKQIKELEENLKKEILTKSELLSKIADAELLNVALKNDLAKQNSVSSEILTKNIALQNEIKTLKNELIIYQSSASPNRCSVSTENKCVMTAAIDNLDVKFTGSEQELSNIIESGDSIDSDTKMQYYYKGIRELSQCKELLRVQYALNNKNKMQIEELQKTIQKNEKVVSDYLRNFQYILRNHEEKLAHIQDKMLDGELSAIIKDFRSTFSVKKLDSFQDYSNMIGKLLNGYLIYLECSLLKSFDKSSITDVTTSAAVDQLQQCELTSDENQSEQIVKYRTINEFMNLMDDKCMVIFELHVEKAHFTYFSGHLMKSSEQNPKIFLTWNFLDDNEHQAYTPTISVSKGEFNCSCQYEGPWSEFLYQYLKQHGIRIEIHLVQGDISVRLAETVVNTYSSLSHINEYQTFSSEFKNDNIEGKVMGNFILKCDRRSQFSTRKTIYE